MKKEECGSSKVAVFHTIIVVVAADQNQMQHGFDTIARLGQRERGAMCACDCMYFSLFVCLLLYVVRVVSVRV